MVSDEVVILVGVVFEQVLLGCVVDVDKVEVFVVIGVLFEVVEQVLVEIVVYVGFQVYGCGQGLQVGGQVGDVFGVWYVVVNDLVGVGYVVFGDEYWWWVVFVCQVYQMLGEDFGYDFLVYVGEVVFVWVFDGFVVSVEKVVCVEVDVEEVQWLVDVFQVVGFDLWGVGVDVVDGILWVGIVEDWVYVLVYVQVVVEVCGVVVGFGRCGGERWCVVEDDVQWGVGDGVYCQDCFVV